MKDVYRVGSIVKFTVKSGKEYRFEVSTMVSDGCSQGFLCLLPEHDKTLIKKFFAEFGESPYDFMSLLYKNYGMVSRCSSTEKFPSWEVKDLNQEVGQIVYGINKAIRGVDLTKTEIRSIDSSNSVMMNSKQMDMKGMFGDMEFGMVEDKALALSMKGIAIYSDKTDSYKVWDSKNSRLVDVMKLTFPVPFFKMPVKKKGIKEGDILLINGSYVIFQGWDNGSMRVINPVKGESAFLLEEVNMLGFKFYTKITSMFKSLGKGGSMMKMMMMSQMFGGKSDDASSSFMGGGNMNSMMQMMMMSQMMGGDDDMGFEDMFDGILESDDADFDDTPKLGEE